MGTSFFNHEGDKVNNSLQSIRNQNLPAEQKIEASELNTLRDFIKTFSL